MAKIKFADNKSTVANAVSNAFSELSSLAEEIREVVDNSESFSETQRIQTLEETASTLEGIDEPDVPDWLGPTEVTYQDWTNSRKGRALSRADRCSWACSVLEQVVEVLEAELADADTDKKSAIEALKSECDDAKNNAEGCEFPGQFG